jgi:PAN domain-containing protein
MKICPVCKRTYADETLNFCLDDGSTLSDSSTPDKSRSLPPTMLPNPAPTEILSPGSMPSSSSGSYITTIQSLQPPPLYSSKPESPPIQRAHGKRWLGITIGAGVVLILGVLSIIWLAQRDESDSQVATKVTNANVKPSPTPTATKEDGVWKERNDAASLVGENLTYYPGTTPEQCQSDCAQDPKCKGFTFIRKGAYNQSDPPMCYLASVVTGETSHKCCISAVKR